MSLTRDCRQPASFPFAASADLTRLAELSALIGLSLSEGAELTDLAGGLTQSYPNGFIHLDLNPNHQDVLEKMRQGETVAPSHAVAALQALVQSFPRPVAPERAPLIQSPAVRLFTPQPISSSRLIRPPMGGVSVATSEGLVQFGTKMWLNKWIHRRYWRSGGDGLSREEVRHHIPTYLIHDSEFAGPDVDLLPYDFIAYLGFPVKETAFTIVAEDSIQAERLRAYMDDSYLGDRDRDLSARVRAEYPDDAIGVPDLLAEITRGFVTRDPETLRHVESFDPRGEVRIGQNVLVRRLGSQRYEVLDQGRSLGMIDLRQFPSKAPSLIVGWRELLKARDVLRLALEEKRSGIWPLGTSDGFDDRGSTSGLMIWNDGRFLLVDPPSHTLDYLEAVGIPLDRMEGVIVTHGHSDHYADAIPRLVRARPDLSLYTTQTIYDLLLDQYRLALGRDDLKAWDFLPVRPQTEIKINGMNFTFDYTFHSVPTIGFEIWDKEELRLYFSGDTFADPDAIEQLLEDDRKNSAEDDESYEPLMGIGRVLRVLRHGFYLYMGMLQETTPVILMEGGMPPIHTPPSVTRSLLREAKRSGFDTSRFFLYHLSNKKARREHVPKLREGAKGWIDLTPRKPLP